MTELNNVQQQDRSSALCGRPHRMRRTMLGMAEYMINPNGHNACGVAVA